VLSIDYTSSADTTTANRTPIASKCLFPHLTLSASDVRRFTGLLAAIPFLGYVAVFGAFLALLGGGSAIAAWAFLATGAVILFTGDKVVRPILVGSSTQLGFVWVLMGTIGGLELLGFIGIFVGPVVLALAGELWRERTTRINRDRTTQVATDTVPAVSPRSSRSGRGE
jgi:AI-2E family transporter